MRIYIDADSVPRGHREIILRRVLGKDIYTLFAADRTLGDVTEAIAKDKALRRKPFRGILPDAEVRKIGSLIEMLVVESGKDSADNALCERAEPPALAVTHDIPLASRLLEKGLVVIDDRGGEYTAGTIRERLQERENNRAFREMGIFQDKTKSFDRKTVREFANTFDRCLSKLLSKEKSQA